MMRLFEWFRERWLEVFLIVGGVVVSAVGGHQLSQMSNRIPILIAMVSAATALALPLGMKQSLSSSVRAGASDALFEAGYYIFILTLVIGWRQLHVTDRLKIHPSEVSIWALFLLYLISNRKRQRRHPLPESLVGLVFLSILGLGTALLNQIAWDVAVFEMKNVLVSIPILLVTREFIRDWERWQRAWLLVVLVLVIIAILGTLEFFWPNLIPSFLRSGAYFGSENRIYSTLGFPRANFSFWGASIVNVLFCMLLVPCFALALSAGEMHLRILYGFAFVLSGISVYIAGGRGSWIGAVIGLALFLYLDERLGWFKALVFAVFVIALAMTLLPANARDGLAAAFGLPGYYESSAYKRWARFSGGVAAIGKSPLIGRGWGSSGWVHSDFVQIAANIGVPAVLLLGIWIGRIAWLIFVKKRAVDSKGYSILSRGMIAGIMVGVWSLATQAILVLPPLIIPFWLLLALAERLPELADQYPDRVSSD